MLEVAIQSCSEQSIFLKLKKTGFPVQSQDANKNTDILMTWPTKLTHGFHENITLQYPAFFWFSRSFSKTLPTFI